MTQGLPTHLIFNPPHKKQRLALYRTFFFAVTGFCCALCFAEDSEEFDWRETPGSNQACKGRYVDPMANDGLETTEDFSTAPIFIDADESVMTDSKIELTGGVEIQQGNRKLHAGHMSYDKSTDEAKLKGDVEFRQPGILLRGSEAWMDMNGEEAHFTGGTFVLHEGHLRGGAGRIEKTPDNKVILEKGEVTTCPPDKESWLLKGEKISVDTVAKRGSGRNVVVQVGKIPILYAPYLSFSLDDQRKSGLLIPYAGTTDGGLDLTIPWYWNIAPNYDATIAPRYAGGHGGMLETEFRYLNSFSLNVATLAYLPDDQGGKDDDIDQLIEEGADESLLMPHKGETRWLFGFQHENTFQKSWFTEMDYTKVSDIDYFRDLSVASFESSNTIVLNQYFGAGLHLPNWYFSARLQGYQSLLADLPDSYRELPRLNADGRYRWGRWGSTLKNELVTFDNRDPNQITGSRMNLDYSIDWRQQSLWGYFRPKVGVQAIGYKLEEDNLNDTASASPTLATAYAVLDTGLTFERAGGRQLLEPRLYFLYRDYADHSELFDVGQGATPEDINFDTTPLTFSYNQLFRERRFTGGDRLGDANQMSIGLTAKWFHSNEVEPFMTASLGQVLYFQDREVLLNSSGTSDTLEESDLAAQFAARLHANWDLKSDFLYNPKTKHMLRATIALDYADQKSRFFRLGYRFVERDPLSPESEQIDQVDGAFSIPYNPQWQVVGRAFYDIEQHKELDAFLGFEYNDCCYRLRVLARRWLDSKLATLVNDESRHYDQGLFFEIELKGLASSGERIRKILAEHLPTFNR